MSTARVAMPEKLIPVFTGDADYRGAYGGRGSGKTRTFAKMTAIRAHMWATAGERGIILCGREYQNSLDESSMAEVKAAIEEEPWLAGQFDIGEKFIRHKTGRIEYAFAGLRHNIASIKSKARIRLLWVDEAEPVSETAWQTAIPSVREDDAEIWVTWNPLRKGSATDKRFKLDPPARSKIIELNWRDNARFPAILNRQRLEDQEKRPDDYDHIWEGDYVGLVEASYYKRQLVAARAKGQFTTLSVDPLMMTYAVWDIGGTGRSADATAIWIMQLVGPQVRFLDYYEVEQQPLAAHVAWLREHGYGNAHCVLPHDGVKGDAVYDVTYEGALKKAGFAVTVIPNQGRGAALKRVEVGRRMFPNIWFDKAKTEAGVEAIGAYHERKDEVRGIGLGPEHDWASHGADAFGLACVFAADPPASGGGWSTLKQQRTRVV